MRHTINIGQFAKRAQTFGAIVKLIYNLYKVMQKSKQLHAFCWVAAIKSLQKKHDSLASASSNITSKQWYFNSWRLKKDAMPIVYCKTDEKPKNLNKWMGG